MTKYKEILRLHSLGLNNTRMSESCGCSRTTVIRVWQRAKESNISWQDIRNNSEHEVSQKLFPKSTLHKQYKMPDYEYGFDVFK